MIHPYTASNVSSLIPKSATAVLKWEVEEWVRNEIIVMNEFLFRSGSRQIVDSIQRMSLQYDLILPMQPRYQNENIHYATPIERIKNYQIFSFNGKLFNLDNSPITTKPLDFDNGAILVMTREGTLFLSHKERNVVHHSTLLASAEVAYACMVEIVDGIIVREEPWSGHYLPTGNHQAQFHDRLQRSCCISVPENLTPIFLMSMNIGVDYRSRCFISDAPLLEPVTLPCGHTFNFTPLKKWYETTPACPCDNKKFEIDKVFFNEDVLKSIKDTYEKTIEFIKQENLNLDNRVVDLKLDDRGSNFIKVSTVLNNVGVMLFLPNDTSITRICKIGEALNLGDRLFGMQPRARDIFESIKENQRIPIITLK